MKISKENYDDIKRYFYHTYVKIKEFGDKVWFVTNVNSQEVRLEDVDGCEVYIDLASEYELDYVIPPRTMFQRGPSAVLLQRIPAKQYYRGMHSSNTKFSYLKGNGGFAQMDWNIKVVQEFVDKPCYQTIESFQDNPDMLDSYALSPIMAVAQNGSLFVGRQKVGMFKFPSRKIKIAPLFEKMAKTMFPMYEVSV